MSVDAGLRSLFRKHLPDVDFLAVETHSTSRGVPDVNYCVAACEGWIEMKEMKGSKVLVSPEQVGWAERRLERGGRVLMAVRRVLRRSDTLMLFSGLAARAFRDEDCVAASHCAFGIWYGGPGRWDWDAVLRAMVGPTPWVGCHVSRGALARSRL